MVIFLAKNFDKIFKTQTFFNKDCTKFVFWFILLKFAEIGDLETANTICCVNSIREFVEIRRRIQVFWTEKFDFFAS